MGFHKTLAWGFSHPGLGCWSSLSILSPAWLLQLPTL